MAALYTMEHFITQSMTVDRCSRLSLIRRSDGLFEASVVHVDGRTATCDTHENPASALWNCLVPYTMRRRLPSGREVVIEGKVHGVTPAMVADDLDDLLGATAAPDDDLEDLLG